MSPQATEMERKTNIDSIQSTLSHWKQRLRELPEVRVEKVQSARGAIRSGCYESERVLDCTLQQLSNELGVLCHGYSASGSA